jgi:hypothetical protein
MYTTETNQDTLERKPAILPAPQAPEEAPHAVPAPPAWKSYQRFLFRVAFIFFVLMSVPNSWNWYESLLAIDWTSLHYRDLYDIARFQPSFVRGIAGIPSLLGYADWFAALALALAGGLIWSVLDRKRLSYNTL